ncbi:HXXEE domain-containing protein [Veillonella parvula]|uniref:HXXEE domain-containing protein n=1 Tax=Veillonella parvula TaxID=29466 RepID=UPI001CB09467|nr:HXXEE domain-containing protein [Veillonella parvula]MBF1323051.1 HXXEE domain-containing protein [Mogibacterium diversum]MBF1356014.1 HXXEE domain-containing protein [Mogibacterium diversum]MDU5400191.1 HXXEE domain-containing protein [Veillonella sp.]
MDLHSFFLLFPSIFMLHELEEILLFPRFMDRNPQLQRRLLSGAFTPFRINAIIYQEFILLLIILGLSVYFESFDFYLTIIIAYIYHVIGHVFQSIFLRQYIPGVLSGIITAGYCTYQIYDAVSANYMILAYSFLTLLIIFVNIILCFKILQMLKVFN